MLYALGSSGSGQLGLDLSIEDPSTPQVVPLPEALISSSITKCAAGGNHSVIVDQHGHAFATGDNSDGRCGTANILPGSHWRPLLSHSGHKLRVNEVTATWSATTVLNRDGQLWSIGSGPGGELGLGGDITHARSWRAIKSFVPPDVTVVQLSSCMAHTLAVLSNGEVYGWGNGRKGQLGSPPGMLWSPRRIEGLPFGVAKAACGKDFSCFISFEGELCIFGPGPRDRFAILAGMPATVPSWKDVVASWGSIFILKHDGKIIAWGRNDRGQLPPQSLPRVRTLAAGSEHCLALDDKGRAITWGWSEHGNCGEPRDPDGNVKGRFNVINVGQHVSAVFAGCATSFLIASRQSAGED